jgi:hypothetical protein
MSLPESVVVLVIDRLGAAWLGPYGNTWLDTPNFNRLASRSTLFETAIVPTPDLTAAYRGLWTGQHVFKQEPTVEPSLPAAAAKNGSALLVTDDESIARHDLASDFSEIQFLRPANIDNNAKAIEEADLVSFFEAATELVATRQRSNLIWLHSRGMSGPWDAPLEMRFRFADEDDPDPPAFVAPPEKLLAADFDPDEILGFVQAYAAQVQIADVCLGILTEALQSHPLADETLFILTSIRGYPLGEHRRVGPCDNALYGELLHVPLLVQFPRNAHRASRNRRIIQPHELFAALQNDSDNSMTQLLAEPRHAAHAAFSFTPGQRAIRTPAWFLRESRHEDQASYELFAKPDDRFEANEISSRCRNVVELLAAEFDLFVARSSDRDPSETPPLAEILYDTWR